MTKETSKASFEVGYGRPPRHTRFQPGMSGNPRGRVKEVCNLGTDVRRTLQTPVKVSEQGKPKRVSTQEAALLRLREKAPKGDARSLDRLLELARLFNSTIDSTPCSDAMMPAEDRAILAAYREDVLAEAGSSIAAELDEIKERGPNNDG
jgi:Family of unknown function (DUF5681)